MRKLLSYILHLKKPTSGQDFGELEVKLMNSRPKARPSFQRDLREQLKSRHQEMMEEKVEKQSGFFYVHRLASSMVLASVLVVFSGAFMVSASSAPVPQNRAVNNLSPDWHPDVMPITIEFDKNMTQRSVEEAFSIYPAVEGDFLWENRQTLHFLPKGPLSPDNQYVVTISEDAKSLFQKPISADFEQKINVFSPELPPRIQNVLDKVHELRANSKNLEGDEKDFIIEKIKELETDLERFFEQKDSTGPNPFNRPQNGTSPGPQVEPSSV